MIEHFKSYIRNICPYMFTEFKQYMMLIFRIVKNYDLYDNTLQYCQHAFHIELIQKNIYFDNNILNLCWHSIFICFYLVIFVIFILIV